MAQGPSDCPFLWFETFSQVIFVNSEDGAVYNLIDGDEFSRVKQQNVKPKLKAFRYIRERIRFSPGIFVV